MGDITEKIRAFLDKNSNDADLILRVLYGCKTSEDVTEELADRFLLDCIEAGFEDLVDRAVQLYKEGSA